VYDITNTPNAHANEAIKTLNRFTRDTFGLGGIFHGAVEVNGEEWSFGAPAPLPCRHLGTALELPGVCPRRRPPLPSTPLHPGAISHPTCHPRQATVRTGQGCVPLWKLVEAPEAVTDPEVGPRPQVYSCAPKGNPNYTFRESIPLGVTSISAPQVRL
jgi:hypothetical protein